MGIVEAIGFPEHHHLVVAFILVLVTGLVLRCSSYPALISHLTWALRHVFLPLILLGRGYLSL